MIITKKLKDISSLIGSGITPRRDTIAFWENGTIPWLKTEQLGEYKIYDTTEKITQQALDETSIKIFPVNTLSIAMYGEGKTRGNVAILKKEMATNQACCNVVIDKKKADFEYVYYFLKTQYNQLRSLSSGVRNNLNSNDIKEFEIRLPDNIPAQQKIASVLSTLDSKIELNNRINAELESMAKTLYDYWFVQFDFPNTAGKPYKTSGGKMVWNEELKREIPEGWEVGTLLDIAKYDNGLPCQKFRPIGIDFLRVIKIREMNEGYSSNTELVRPNIPKKSIVENGDVLFSLSASLEVKIWTGGKGALNQHIFKVTSDKYPKSYYYFQLLNYLQHFKMMAENRKTTMGHITQDHLQQSRISIPPQELTLKLEKIIAPVFDKIENNKLENQQLSEIRDWLLPMLMNGQVMVGSSATSYEIEEEMKVAAEPERIQY
jgi:type I restriction enzyme S subunit